MFGAKRTRTRYAAEGGGEADAVGRGGGGGPGGGGAGPGGGRSGEPRDLRDGREPRGDVLVHRSALFHLVDERRDPVQAVRDDLDQPRARGQKAFLDAV